MQAFYHFVCACVSASVFARVCMFMFVCVRVPLHTCDYMFAYMRVCLHALVCVFACACFVFICAGEKYRDAITFDQRGEKKAEDITAYKLANYLRCLLILSCCERHRERAHGRAQIIWGRRAIYGQDRACHPGERSLEVQPSRQKQKFEIKNPISNIFLHNIQLLTR